MFTYLFTNCIIRIRPCVVLLHRIEQLVRTVTLLLNNDLKDYIVLNNIKLEYNYFILHILNYKYNLNYDLCLCECCFNQCNMLSKK